MIAMVVVERTWRYVSRLDASAHDTPATHVVIVNVRRTGTVHDTMMGKDKYIVCVIHHLMSLPEDTPLLLWGVQLHRHVSISNTSHKVGVLTFAFDEHLNALANSGIFETVPSTR